MYDSTTSLRMLMILSDPKRWTSAPLSLWKTGMKGESIVHRLLVLDITYLKTMSRNCQHTPTTLGRLILARLRSDGAFKETPYDGIYSAP